jgi:hypothetical protein
MKLKWISGALLGVSLLAGMAPARAGFSMYVVPPRFELKAQPGEVLRQTVEVVNAFKGVGEYVVYTLDWDMDEQYQVTFGEASQLAENSCRPWVKIERRELKMQPEQRKKYRFEVHVPEGTPDGECRFAIALGPDPASIPAPEKGVSLPVVGRIAVIVYVVVGGARPELQIEKLALKARDGQVELLLTASNTGNAHGRLSGLLNAEDGAGRALDVRVSELPILPGHTQTLRLRPTLVGGEEQVAIQPPLKLNGLVEWPGGQYPVDVLLNPP